MVFALKVSTSHLENVGTDCSNGWDRRSTSEIVIDFEYPSTSRREFELVGQSHPDLPRGQVIDEIVDSRTQKVRNLARSSS